ncbi:putative WRKY transcription factor 16 -like protein [Gossypium arboreum]|uniref:Putative WRKY transcription factor 16-like protein n=1 Tax=Gossypium arboreum TaxID=29729 RepID=A0A0B0NZU9_GOSAR|nr:putative WRKY transcription factor 16 -like protein [Gossypium arboreum]
MEASRIDYASSISSLVELSDIMDSKRKPTDKHIVLPIFYHVDPSDVRNIGGSFKTSFEEHKSKQPADIVQQWKSAFAEIGKLKGWHIEGGKFDSKERYSWIISMHDMLEEMGKDIACQESTTLGKCSRLWSPKHVEQVLTFYQDLVHLRKINLFSCKKLKKIPNLLGALNLERLDCENCESLVKLPSLAHLTSLKTLRIKGCRSLKKFPEIPNNFYELDLSETGIKKVPDFIERLDRLERLTLTNSMVKDVSSNISKLKSLKVLDLSGCPIVKSPEIPRSLTGLYLSGTQIEEVDLSSNSRAKDASSNISKLGSLYFDGCPIVKSSFPTVDVPLPSLMFMCTDCCKSLNLLSELPPYLHELNVHDCTSLEKVSFADQNLYQFDYLDADDTCFHAFTMLFCNCFNLNQESINNIEANAMLKIGSLAKKWAARYDVWEFKYCCNIPSLICCFPGNKISTNKFKCQSMNSSLSLKIAPNGGSGSRFLVFAICLVADLDYCPAFEHFECFCEWQLTGSGGGGHEKFRVPIHFSSLPEPEKFMGDHVFILSGINMVVEDENYEEASFEFKIRYIIFDEEEDLLMFKRIEVERCGVHVFYVDAESNADSNVESSENPNLNEMSSDESNDRFYFAEDAIFEEVDGDTQPRLQL